MIRVVLDTNVLVSALIRQDGNCNQIVSRADSEFTWLTSEYILDETARVLTRKHIQAKYGRWVTPARQAQFLFMTRALAELIDVRTTLAAVVKDAKDDPVLACAVDGRADYLVTGDPHLLALKQYADILLATPKRLLTILDEMLDRP
jgi:uncharacterized protein